MQTKRWTCNFVSYWILWRRSQKKVGAFPVRAVKGGLFLCFFFVFSISEVFRGIAVVSARFHH